MTCECVKVGVMIPFHRGVNRVPGAFETAGLSLHRNLTPGSLNLSGKLKFPREFLIRPLPRLYPRPTDSELLASGLLIRARDPVCK